MKRIIALLLLVCFSAYAQVLLTITKTNYEQFDCSMDFVNAVAGDTITLDSVIATSSSGNTTTQVIAASPAPAIQGTKVIFRVRAGNRGEIHTISVRVIDSTTGEKFEGLMQLRIS